MATRNTVKESDASPLLTRLEARSELRISESTYERLVRLGLLHEIAIGKRKLLPRSEITRFIRNGGAPCVDAA